LDGSEHATEAEAKSHLNHNSYQGYSRPSVIISADDTFNGKERTTKIDTINVESSILMHIDTSYEQEITIDGDTLDANITDESSRYWAVDDVVTHMNFTCPKCGRSFLGDWMGCHKHVVTRKHGPRCSYASDNSNSSPNSGMLPSCLSEHSMLPLDEHSGWCELQGRRRYMEDMHSVVFEESYKLFGVFDGHSGAKAARFASKRLHTLFDLYLSTEATSTSPVDPLEDLLTWQEQAERLGRINVELRDPETKLFAVSSGGCDNFTESSVARGSELLVSLGSKKDNPDDVHDNDNEDISRSQGITVAHAIRAMKEAFLHTNSDLASTMSANDLSGSTASLAVQFQDHLLIANVGDSRVVLCCSSTAQLADINTIHSNTTDNSSDKQADRGMKIISHPVQLTVDHTPYDPVERIAVEGRGGFISEDGVFRVNGKLAVSRSLGDYSHSSVLSSEPDVFVLRLSQQPTLASTPPVGDTSMGATMLSEGDVNTCDGVSNSTHSTGSSTGTMDRDSMTIINFCSTYRQAVASNTNMHIPTEGSAYLQPLFLILASGKRESHYFIISIQSQFLMSSIFLFSDGLWDHVTGAEATEIVCEFLLSQIIKGSLSNTDTCTSTMLKYHKFVTSKCFKALKFTGTGNPYSSYFTFLCLSSNSPSAHPGLPHQGISGNREHSSRGTSNGDGRRGRSLLLPSAMHDAARLLAVEAYVRGSTDNVGVCVVDLLP
jgi:serine/threonine protein phosphatase PrpC/ribosomal protein S27AE